MPSCLVTGASRGIGFEFLRQLSADPANTVIALVRDKAATQKKVDDELARANVHVLQADITDYAEAPFCYRTPFRFVLTQAIDGRG